MNNLIFTLIFCLINNSLFLNTKKIFFEEKKESYFAVLSTHNDVKFKIKGDSLIFGKNSLGFLFIKKQFKLKVRKNQIRKIANAYSGYEIVNGGRISPSLVKREDVLKRFNTFFYITSCIEEESEDNIKELLMENLDTLDIRFHVNMLNEISAIRVYSNNTEVKKIANGCVQKLSQVIEFIESDNNKGTNQIHLINSIKLNHNSITNYDLKLILKDVNFDIIEKLNEYEQVFELINN